MDRIIPNILAKITGVGRVRPETNILPKGSWTRCAFRLWEMVVWRRFGIRVEERWIVKKEGVEYRAYTLEAFLNHLEQNVRGFFKSFSFGYLQIPVLAFENGFDAGKQIRIPYISFAIAHDTDTTTAGTASTPLTQAVNTGSTNPLLTVGLIGSADTDNLTGITANGSSMTKVGSTIFAGRETYLYWIIGVSGSFNVVSSRSASGDTYMQMDIVSYTGAKQTGQPDASITNTGSTATLTVVVANSWVVGMFQAQGGTITSVTNGTQRSSGGAGYGVYDSNGPQAAGSFTFTQNGGVGTLASLAASFSPAVAATNNGMFAIM